MERIIFLICFTSLHLYAMHHRSVPSLRLLAAQKVHELERSDQFTREQKELLEFFRIDKEKSVPIAMCHNTIRQEYTDMPKEKAENYAILLCTGQLRDSQKKRVSQKRVGWEMRIALNR